MKYPEIVNAHLEMQKSYSIKPILNGGNWMLIEILKFVVID